LEAPLAVVQQTHPDWLTDEDTSFRGLVTLVTLAAVLHETALASDTPLRTLNNVTREEVRDAVLDAVRNPVRHVGGGRPSTADFQVLKLVVALEEPRHFHVALKIHPISRFMPFKQALRNRSGFASHWSTSHTQFWSAVRYLVCTTAKKPEVDSGCIVWTPSGQGLDLYQEAQEPFNALALKRRREQSELLAAGAVAKGKAKAKTEKFTRVDFTALVIAGDLWTPNSVMAHVKTKGSAAAWDFVQRHQHRLKELLALAKEWHSAEAAAEAEQLSDWDAIQRLSRNPCKCGGMCAWTQAPHLLSAVP